MRSRGPQLMNQTEGQRKTIQWTRLKERGQAIPLIVGGSCATWAIPGLYHARSLLSVGIADIPPRLPLDEVVKMKHRSSEKHQGIRLPSTCTMPQFLAHILIRSNLAILLGKRGCRYPHSPFGEIDSIVGFFSRRFDSPVDLRASQR
jgi:hypothetical protein